MIVMSMIYLQKRIRGKMKFIYVFFLIFSVSLFAQVEHSKSTRSLKFYQDFDVEIANYPTKNPKRNRVDVFIKVPYGNIKFVKSENNFEGKYTVTITIYDDDKDNILVEKMWSEKLIAKDFLQATSNKNYKFSYKSFELDPGKYLIRVELFDEDSKKNSYIEIKKNILQFDSPIKVSDIIFLTDSINTSSGIKYIPSVSNKFTDQDSSFRIMYEIHSDKKQNMIIEYRINNIKTGKSIVRFVNEQVDSGKNIINYKVAKVKLSLGEYVFEVRVKDDEYNLVAETAKKFVSKIIGYPSSIMDLDKAIEQMIYISTNDELESIKSIQNYDEKMLAFLNFWKKKDPTPNTEENELLYEYYRRVEYANENFKHYFEGWKTDMGMIYIILGAPSNVERHPFEYNSKPYEIWDYYDINRRFVFIDQTGFGDYRLLNQNYGDWYRYRP